MSRPVFTYQARLALDKAGCDALDAYARIHGRMERSLFAALRSGGDANKIKRDFLLRFGVSARQCNSARVELQGKIASIRERQPELLAECKERIRKAARVIAKFEAKAPGSNKLHQKKRRLRNLEERRAGLLRLCFGGRKLFRAQFDLEANGYADHKAWREAWRRARDNQFFVLGSRDETAGNQTCQAIPRDDGTFDLKLRLPHTLADQGKHLTIAGVRFAYGGDAIRAALGSGRRILSTTASGRSVVKRTGAAVSYRFLRDEKGWRVFASVEAQPVELTTTRSSGAIGLDINPDHLALSETDRFGNQVDVWRTDLPLYGKSAEQAKALIGDACVELVRIARERGKPIVLERLDLRQKKADLETADPRRARLLSSFAYRKTAAFLNAAAFRHGVEIIEVEPVYTSVIGAVNFARRQGISVHQGAAYAVARRGLGLSERPAVREAVVPTRNGGHVTFALPVRNRAKHVWSFWAGVRTRLKAAHAAHARSGGLRKPPAPLLPETRALGATWTLPAQSRHANRRQHCSAGVVEDLPR
ncbi:hypothetical protein MAMC_02006 [Methylacidimicrobium cyclopophantes]|uniref:Uncharacterized protein n=1 Tax=Methylacidimicrobium cyclopophantes TaxID=1041766 RepID=A0A5E6MJP6_9BACT|nr:IS200/IS605 family element transposase accessory protein TnpB [Methylacidimicrobium cyclopophantes]VVM08185.1 hypothetical protein MAMC_02006 [Methylacidimicrobium cyclopophantes]